MIAGHLDGSLLDWPGRLVTVLFFQGCPLRCPYCYNGDVVLGRTGEDWDYAQAMEHLRTPLLLRLLDGIVLSGGDPLWQLVQGTDEAVAFLTFLRSVRAEGYPVKIDTSLACGDVDVFPSDVWFSATLKPQSYYGSRGAMAMADNLEKLGRRGLEHLELRVTVQGGAVEDLYVTMMQARRALRAYEVFPQLRISYEPVRVVDGHPFGGAQIPTYLEYQSAVSQMERLFPDAVHDVRSKEMVL